MDKWTLCEIDASRGGVETKGRAKKVDTEGVRKTIKTLFKNVHFVNFCYHYSVRHNTGRHPAIPEDRNAQN